MKVEIAKSEEQGCLLPLYDLVVDGEKVLERHSLGLLEIMISVAREVEEQENLNTKG